MMNHIKVAMLLASFIGAFVLLQACKTTHVVHIHNGEPVETVASEHQVDIVDSIQPEELLPVDITMIIDRSGSMGVLREQVIASYNDFIDDQKTVDSDASVSLIQFDDKYEPNYTNIDIQSASELTTTTYEPRGSTALFDAIGRAISEAQDRIKPGSSDVVFVITTDGLENASTDYSGEQIKELIADCEDQYGWHFMYLAASDDAFNQHQDMGINVRSCLKLEATPESWDASQKLMSQQLLEYRISPGREANLLEFNDEDRSDDE